MATYTEPRGIERRVVRQVSPGSVARIALGVGVSFTAIVMVGLVALLLLATASGASRSVDAFLGGLGLSLDLISVLPVSLIVMIVFTGVITVLGALLAVIYNLLADVLGGVEVVTRERPTRGSGSGSWGASGGGAPRS